MEKMFEWFRLGILATGKTREMKWIRKQASEAGDGGQSEAKRPRKEDEEPPFDEKVANHLSRLAQMLSYRTDDPNTGVGCVIAIKDEIVSIGWNGFPSKARYGNHPRGSKDDDASPKYPHVIHAIQNALLCRNRRELEGSIVYTTKVPFDDGISMLYQLGAKTLVLPSSEEKDKNPEEQLFNNLMQLKKLTVHVVKQDERL
jgi:deoxycytidylate deaminase